MRCPFLTCWNNLKWTGRDLHDGGGEWVKTVVLWLSAVKGLLSEHVQKPLTNKFSAHNLNAGLSQSQTLTCTVCTCM